MDYKRKAHSVYLMTYHIVFVTKYRDHIHLLVSMPPQECQSDLIRVLKTQTSKRYIRIKTMTNI